MKEVMSSAAEAEFGSLYHNGKAACPHRTCLEELRHPQPPTPLVTDNIRAVGIANDTVKQKRSKAMDMRFYWIRDRVCQGQFVVYWKKGTLNKANYHTKHHSRTHHCCMRFRYLKRPRTPGNYYACLDYDVTPAKPRATLLTSVLRAAKILAKSVIPLRVTAYSGEGVLIDQPQRRTDAGPSTDDVYQT
jgi:hypothetical protein